MLSGRDIKPGDYLVSPLLQNTAQDYFKVIGIKKTDYHTYILLLQRSASHRDCRYGCPILDRMEGCCFPKYRKMYRCDRPSPYECWLLPILNSGGYTYVPKLKGMLNIGA